MKKVLPISIITLVIGLLLTGFFLLDKNPMTKSQVILGADQIQPAPYVSNLPIIYTDNFDAANDTNALKARGYKVWYRGTGPQGLTATWFTPTAPPPFNAFNGPTTGYVAANYNAVTGTNNIDSWLVLPRLTGGLQAGDSLYYYSRSPTGSVYPDSVRVMYSANDSVPEGTWTELGRYKVTIAGSWELKGFRAPTTSVNGRFAIRYCVVGGGPSGLNSDFIGIDAMTIVRTATACNYTWANQTSGTAVILYSVKTVNDLVAWAVGATGVVRKTTNGGTTWADGDPGNGITADIYNVEAIDANTAWCTTSPGATFIYKTTNGGTNWVQVYTLAAAFINAIKMVTPTNGYAFGDPAGGNWLMLQTTNGGTNWTTLATVAGTGDGRNNCLQVTLPNIWFGTGQGPIWRSTNSGINWANSPSGITTQITGLHFNSATVGLAGGASMMKSTDGGVTWAPLAALGTGTITGIQGTGSDYWYVRGTGVYRSTNDGAAWTQVHTAAQTQNDISLGTGSNGCLVAWSVGSTGSIAKMTGQPVGINIYNNEVPKAYMLQQNYPNPFNPSTTIRFSIPTNGNVELKVYDLLGKEIAVLVNEYMPTGNYSVDFDASSISSGIYFYTLKSADFIETKKMVLIK